MNKPSETRCEPGTELDEAIELLDRCYEAFRYSMRTGKTDTCIFMMEQIDALLKKYGWTYEKIAEARKRVL